MYTTRQLPLWRSLFLLFPLLSVMACGEESPYQEDQLLGRWEIEAAFRNGTETESLVDLFFEFQEENRLLTNLSSVEEVYRYELDGEQIHQREGGLNTSYQIEEFLDDRLILSTRIRNYNFRFVLQRAGSSEELIQ